MRENGIFAVQDLMCIFMRGISREMRSEIEVKFEIFSGKFAHARELEIIETSPEARARNANSLDVKGEMLKVIGDMMDILDKAKNFQEGDANVLKRIESKLIASIEETQACCGGFQTKWQDLLE